MRIQNEGIPRIVAEGQRPLSWLAHMRAPLTAATVDKGSVLGDGVQCQEHNIKQIHLMYGPNRTPTSTLVIFYFIFSRIMTLVSASKAKGTFSTTIQAIQYHQ